MVLSVVEARMGDLGRRALSITEALTQQFYDWECRGRGWQLWPEPVELEPPFRPLYVSAPAREAVDLDDGRRPTFLSRFTDRLLGQLGGAAAETVVTSSEELACEPEPAAWGGSPDLSELLIAVPADLDVSRPAAEQALLGIPRGADPVAFELLGAGDQVRVSLACARKDEPAIAQPLKALFPEALISREPELLTRAWHSTDRGGVLVVDFGLAREFMVPLRTPRRFDADPLAGVVAALAGLTAEETAVFQVLFTRTRAPWADETMRAVLDDRGAPFFIDAPQVTAGAKLKVSRPLFACLVRAGVAAGSQARALSIVRQMGAALSVLGDPLGNELIPLDGGGYDAREHEADLLLRRSRRSGMILGLDELVSFVHLPSRSIREPRLVRHGRKTRAAPRALATGQAVLGQNMHDGSALEVHLTAEQRSRHMYVVGASGTGKSTLLLNLIRQDLERGEGLALFDPHGDLVDRVLGLVPEERLNDVILVDPGDSEHPVGFNILSATSELEQTLLASDLVALFQRLSMSWGDQMTSVLGNSILAFLENDRVGTLLDLRRFLVEPGFRREVLATVRDPDVGYFWQHEFPMLRGKPQSPILTRLDTFLRPKPIRYMVAQGDSRLDLRRVMDEGKVLLCRLSHGAIGEENAYLLGTLLVSKLHQVAMSRQDTAEELRRPFYLYIDEFHHFVTPSMAAILSGARKYRLGLTLAHQDLRQLQSRSTEVYSAVLANPCTRACFRLGDEDAAVLAKGFASFDARDLQNLGVGEAIARVERADHDFNLRTAPLPKVDPALAEAKRARVVANTREQYGRRRAEIEETLWRARPDSASGAKAEPPTDGAKMIPSADRHRRAEPPSDSESVIPPTVVSASRRDGAVAESHAGLVPAIPSPQAPEAAAPRPGRGGPQHTYLQELIRRWADAHDWRATVEEPVLDGLGRVDVALRKGETSVAVEIVVSSPAEHEVKNLQKCLAAGFDWAVEVSSQKRRLGQVRALAKVVLPPNDFARAAFVNPEELFELLPALETPATEQGSIVRGYRVRVRVRAPGPEGHEGGKGAVSAVIAKALRRIKAGAKQKGE